jgi:hypothetical protein
MSARTVLMLANGHGIDLIDPQPADIDFASFAEQLAKEARFNGATPGVAYSVAEHLVRGADAILRTSGDRQLAAYWSLHDAHEAVLKDDTTPKKRAIAELCAQQFGILAEHVLATFDRLTDRHDAAIHAAAGLPWPMPADMAAQVKAWDLTLFVTEWRDLMRARTHPDWTPYRDITPLPETIRPWPWPFARLALQVRWRRLLPALAPIEQAV